MSNEGKDKLPLSCVDCAVTACRYGREDYPVFCPTKNMPAEKRVAVIPEYFADEQSAAFSTCSIEVEGEYYGQMARVEETMEFARRVNARKIGLAYCVEMEAEAELYTHILEINGFEVTAVGCKVGELDEGETLFGKPNGRLMCNPLGQAKLLDEAGTDFNLLMGLCPGSDTLFIKACNTMTSVLINKDRLTCNNPAVTLYRPERRKLV